jgi:hypothetical protein
MGEEPLGQGAASRVHRSNSLITRLGSVGRGHVALGADMDFLRFGAHRKDLEGKSAILVASTATRNS